jgi:ABC-type transporter MlaC component
MKKWMTLLFASMFALALSMPAWSQATNSNKQATPAAAKKDDKDTKDTKKAESKKKSKKKAAKKADDKSDAKKDASKK